MATTVRRSTRRSNAPVQGRSVTVTETLAPVKASRSRTSKRVSTTRTAIIDSAPIVDSTSVEEDETVAVCTDTVVAHTSPPTMRTTTVEIEAALNEALALGDGAALRSLLVEVERAGDASLLARVRQAYKEHCVEANRLHGMLQYEQQILADERARLVAQGCTDVEAAMQRFAIVGVDEVGVGPLAGPCVGGAVVLHKPAGGSDDDDDDKAYGMHRTFIGINDSKKLKPLQREQLAEQIQRYSVCHALGICTSQEVDTLNPRAASMEAMRRAVQVLLDGPLRGHRVHLLVDYHTVPGMASDMGQTCLEKGDAKSQSIAAASIVAKVYRDAYMTRLHQQHPHFGFDRNAGYGTREHMSALLQGRLCPEHRLSFAPVRAAHEKLLAEQHEPTQERDQQQEDVVVVVKPMQKRTRKAMLPISVNKARRRAQVVEANARPTRRRA